MRDLRGIIIMGIREAVPKAQNFTKAFETQQQKDESPNNFLQRLRNRMRKYSGMNSEDPLAQGLLKVHFVTKAWLDIQKKLQKMEGWSEKPLETLLQEAQKADVRRGEEKERQSKTKDIHAETGNGAEDWRQRENVSGGEVQPRAEGRGREMTE